MNRAPFEKVLETWDVVTFLFEELGNFVGETLGNDEFTCGQNGGHSVRAFVLVEIHLDRDGFGDAAFGLDATAANHVFLSDSSAGDIAFGFGHARLAGFSVAHVVFYQKVNQNISVG